MDTFLAIVILIVFVWLAIPRLIHGQWLAPTAVAPNSWEASYAAQNGLADTSIPAQSFGWFHFDFWNHPPLSGQPASSADYRFKSPRNEFK